jgi:hypothetical protein
MLRKRERYITTMGVFIDGRCNICAGEFDKKAIADHLKVCLQRRDVEEAEAGVQLLQLLVEGRYLPMYWLYLEVPATATLKELDAFLRRTWLECCDHLSSFTIKRVYYSSDGEEGIYSEVTEPLENLYIHSEVTEPFVDVQTRPAEEDGDDPALADLLKRIATPLDLDFQEHSMEVALASALRLGRSCVYEYDFNSPTKLTLRVVGEREGAPPRGGIEVLARNKPPRIPCSCCKKPATRIFAGSFYIEDAAFCDECAVGKGDLEHALPVVNSPRVGVCLYAGTRDDDDGAATPEPLALSA